jgi:hypothetical protein
VGPGWDAGGSALRDALALAGEWDPDGTPAAQAALEWMGWEGDGPLWLRRYDVQLFVWYTLPRKFLTALEHKQEAAAALARTLERLGDRAATYAEVCRSPETDQLLHAWDADDPAAWKRFRELLDQSGIEPPDTDFLAWGQVMGFEEARVREQVATVLEEAIEDGRLSPGSAGFRRRQAEAARAALHEPWDGGDDFSRLDAVRAERLERWLVRGHTRGSDERRAIIARVADVIAADAPSVEPEAARAALAPALWLLERAADGIALTQTGALNRALVREVVERWPAWWHTELFGQPNREDEVTPIHELHGLLRRLRLVRRAGRQVVVTARGPPPRRPAGAARGARAGAARRRELSRRLRRTRGRADAGRRRRGLRRRPRRDDPTRDRRRGLAIGWRVSRRAGRRVGGRRVPAPGGGDRDHVPRRARLASFARSVPADRPGALSADRRAARSCVCSGHGPLLRHASSLVSRGDVAARRRDRRAARWLPRSGRG